MPRRGLWERVGRVPELFITLAKIALLTTSPHPLEILWGDKASQNTVCSFCPSDVLGEASQAVSLSLYVVVKVQDWIQCDCLVHGLCGLESDSRLRKVGLFMSMRERTGHSTEGLVDTLAVGCSVY